MVSVTRAAPLFTVIVPTHNHASTLDISVNSVLHQSVEAIDVVIIGDGVGDDTRDVASSLMSDPRVRFIDRPKSPSRAELVRHEVLSAARTPYVCYLGDDDLMLPDHLELTMERLQKVDLTHPLPVYIELDGSMGCLHLTDISDPRCVAWHLVPGQNAISLTGAGHRLDAYMSLPFGWREPPPGIWSDHYMWQQWFRVPSMRFSTSDRLTVLKFFASSRQDMTGAERRGELEEWLNRCRSPDFASTLNTLAQAAVLRSAALSRIELEEARRDVADSLSSLDLLAAELKWAKDASAAHAADARTHAADARAHAADARAHAANAEELWTRAQELQRGLSEIHSTRTWRLHDRLARWSIIRWLANR